MNYVSYYRIKNEHIKNLNKQIMQMTLLLFFTLVFVPI